MAEEDPFRKQKPGAAVKLYVAFLARAPEVRQAFPLTLEKEGLEVFGMRGQDVFILSRRINGRYGFPNNFIEKSFGVPATTRNWNTVVKIVDFAMGG